MRLHGEPPRRALDARAGPPRRQGEELAAAAQGRRAPKSARVRADARHCHRRRCRSARAGRSSRSGTGSGPSRASTAASSPSGAATTTTSRPRFAAAARAVGLAVRSPSAVLDGEICALDETGRSGFGAAPAGSGRARLRRLRRARGGRRAAHRPDLRRAARGARAARRHLGRGRPRLAVVRRRCRARARRARARARGGRRQAGRLAVPAGAPHDGLAQAEAEEQPGARHRRLHARPGPPLERDRSARARRPRGRRAPLRGQRRHRVHRPRARSARERS